MLSPQEVRCEVSDEEEIRSEVNKQMNKTELELLDAFHELQVLMPRENIEDDATAEDDMKCSVAPRILSEVRAAVNSHGEKLTVGAVYKSLSKLKTHVAEHQEVYGLGTRVFRNYNGTSRPLILMCECQEQKRLGFESGSRIKM